MTNYIETFIADTTAELRGQISDEAIDQLRETVTPFLPLVLKHALRLSDARLTAFAHGSGGWVNYCWTGPDGMVIKLLYPTEPVDPTLTPIPKPDSYSVPYSIFFSDQDIDAWRDAKDAEFISGVEAANAAAQATLAAASAAAKQEYDLALLNVLIAQYGIPEGVTPPSDPPPVLPPSDPPPAPVAQPPAPITVPNMQLPLPEAPPSDTPPATPVSTSDPSILPPPLGQI